MLPYQIRCVLCNNQQVSSAQPCRHRPTSRHSKKSSAHQKILLQSQGLVFPLLLVPVTRFCVITSPNFSPTGIPTFRGAGGMWRRYNAMELATPDGFAESPSLVWQFYHYRRETLVNHSHTYNAIEACLELSRPTRMMPIGLSPRSRSLRSEIRSHQNPALNS